METKNSLMNVLIREMLKRLGNYELKGCSERVVDNATYSLAEEVLPYEIFYMLEEYYEEGFDMDEEEAIEWFTDIEEAYKLYKEYNEQEIDEFFKYANKLSNEDWNKKYGDDPEAVNLLGEDHIYKEYLELKAEILELKAELGQEWAKARMFWEFRDTYLYVKGMCKEKGIKFTRPKGFTKANKVIQLPLSKTIE